MAIFVESLTEYFEKVKKQINSLLDTTKITSNIPSYLDLSRLYVKISKYVKPIGV